MILDFGFLNGRVKGVAPRDWRVKGFGPRDGGGDCYEQRRTFLLV